MRFPQSAKDQWKRSVEKILKKYSLEIEFGITVVSFNSTPNYEDIIELLNYLAENDLYKKRLFDLTNIEFDLPALKLSAVASYSKSIFLEKNKGAVVANLDLGFGATRQLAAYREDEISILHSYRKKQDAIDWLLCD